MAYSAKVCISACMALYSVHLTSKYTLNRKRYGLDRGAVFPNLTKGNLGRPLVKEAFRKMFHNVIQSVFIPPYNESTVMFAFPLYRGRH